MTIDFRFDAIEGSLDSLGHGYGSQIVVMTSRDAGTLSPVTGQTFFVDPSNYRFHDTGRVLSGGLMDRRASIQVLLDYDSPVEDAEPGAAPYQPEFHSVANRSTRFAETGGNSALGTSLFRVIDSYEDSRFVLALVSKARPLFGDVPGFDPPFPDDLQAAVDKNNTLESQRHNDSNDLTTREKTSVPQTQSRNVDLRPEGYVWSTEGKAGLLGSFFEPCLSTHSYGAGLAGTPTGPLVARFDAQFGKPNPEKAEEPLTGPLFFEKKYDPKVGSGVEGFDLVLGSMVFDESMAENAVTRFQPTVSPGATPLPEETSVSPPDGVGGRRGMWRPAVLIPKPKAPPPIPPVQGPPGPPGKNGINGKNGANGKDGKDGGQGRDGEGVPCPNIQYGTPGGGITGPVGPYDPGQPLAVPGGVFVPGTGFIPNTPLPPSTVPGGGEVFTGPPVAPGPPPQGGNQTQPFPPSFPQPTSPIPPGPTGWAPVIPEPGGGLTFGPGGPRIRPLPRPGGRVGTGTGGGIGEVFVGTGGVTVANFPIGHVGQPGGADDMAGQVALLTSAFDATRTMVNSLMGGPDYYAGNIVAIHTNLEGTRPEGSVLGQAVYSGEGEDIQVSPSSGPFQVISITDTTAGGRVNYSDPRSPEQRVSDAENGIYSTGVLTVAREHVGEGIDDDRPLLHLDNDRTQSGDVDAHLVDTTDGAFWVNFEGQVGTGTREYVHVDPASFSDGQVVAFDAASGKFVPTTPSVGTTYPVAPTGGSCSATGTGSLAIGNGSDVQGDKSKGIGDYAFVHSGNHQSNVIGYNAAIGSSGGNSAIGGTAFGYQTLVDGTFYGLTANYGSAFGWQAWASGDYALALGYNANAGTNQCALSSKLYEMVFQYTAPVIRSNTDGGGSIGDAAARWGTVFTNLLTVNNGTTSAKGDLSVSTSTGRPRYYTSAQVEADTPAAEASVDSDGLACALVIRKSFPAGAGGSADDVTIYNSNAPFGFRVLDAVLYTSTNVGGSTVTARTASGGGGSALSDALSSAATGATRNASLTATGTVAAGGSLYLRRSDNGAAGEIVLTILKT